ncbi:UDP-N-acetylmuramate dehydrogenase [Paenibacillus lycopersici]|uniref:UDP-N-acetylenolpyruvoylglucosamine reductase n=2 Tax=Paenibacillus lycopersici TaxID=2704462 RepID=A0A6C0G7R8_9BACL|nr:UDP-N-acetylmuramate dehydrogenase [Paenibacillus lycopersici]
MKVGGQCTYYIVPNSIDEVVEVKRNCRLSNTPIFVLGNGSNIIVNDRGFDGVVLHIGKGLKEIQVNEDHVYAEAGVALPLLSNLMAKYGIGGFEFYAGIPGTIGGAVVMNAGCIGHDTSEIVKSIIYIDENEELQEVEVHDANFHFRSSRFHGQADIIVAVKFHLRYADDIQLVQQKTKMAADIRKGKFPINVATVGSTFKSPPEGPHPGRLIEEAGLKGYKIGGAEISHVHANWIINDGSATADDIRRLIIFIKESVYIKFNILLEEEAIYV